LGGKKKGSEKGGESRRRRAHTTGRAREIGTAFDHQESAGWGKLHPSIRCDKTKEKRKKKRAEKARGWGGMSRSNFNEESEPGQEKGVKGGNEKAWERGVPFNT